MSACVQDLSGFSFMYQSQFLKYRTAWFTFNRVQTFNSNVSTLRAAGETNLSYYQFLTNQEKNNFQIGRFLHVQSYPNSNWDLVQEN
jgi:hypothetical protein